ncbi:hypothetical protein LOSG293_410130 [Secundilactobacillus oryzae JCM 18671]|uniref:Uncharacterized protein n=1 Tax=Secundilactobacillus oryzae JCM 18671 TaxID=1291743 RepID=A0A081BKP5_9LACO|nr:hypothetical protein [Secundilactobacillus oryzae]GAK48613.1 hypothetical protein LOSG293_410130 [Secundilactobacillus oryzae JCM 18671]
MSSRMMINPDKFASGFANAAQQRDIDESKVVEESKKYLLNYLTAYYLVEDFNEVEQKNFEGPHGPNDELRFEDMSFEQLMERVRKLNKY